MTAREESEGHSEGALQTQETPSEEAQPHVQVLGPDGRPANRHLIEMRATQHHVGPLPSPETLQRYDHVIPGLAERIVQMAEAEQRHRHMLQRETLQQTFRIRTAGVTLGFILALATLGLGSWLMYLGQDASGLTAFIVAVTSLAGVFIVNRLKPGSTPTPLPAPPKDEGES